LQFVAIDVETANADMASICQIGIARIVDGTLSAEWKSYVDPQDDFDVMNVWIHGIDQAAVAGAPTFDQVADQIAPLLNGQIVVTHTHFDRVSLCQASGKWNVQLPSCHWLDSARVARRAWAELAHRGYGLANVCQRIGYEFRHHDALEDAKAAAQIMLAAIAQSGLDLDQWTKRVCQPLNPSKSGPIVREGNPAGPLYGEVLVFTGSLQIPRREAADMAASIGCEVGRGVTRDTTLLVVGDQDIRHLAGHTKSSKHRKAEDLIHKGVPIRILRETDFKELVALVN
jgi:DNA polymerase III subunit epsilon